MRCASRYGRRLIESASGSLKRRSGASSRSASASVPTWCAVTRATAPMPVSGGRNVSAPRPGPMSNDSQRSRDVGREQLLHELAELDGAVDRVDDAAVGDHRVERVQPELERGGDAEVGAGAAQAPEELRVLVLARPHLAAVGGDEVDREQVVDREPVCALQAAEPAAEREARDAGVRDRAHRACERVLLRRVVELARAGSRRRRAPSGARRRPRRLAAARRR